MIRRRIAPFVTHGARRGTRWCPWRTVFVVGAVVACTGTNIVAPTAGTGGTIVFASDRTDGIFQLYAASGDGRDIRRITTEGTNNDLAPVLSPDGLRVAWQREITNAAGSIESVEIWVADVDGSRARAVVSNGSFNESPSWTHDGALIYASRVTGNWEIFRSPVDGGEAVNLSRHPFADQYPRVSPDGSRILFHSNRDVNFEIYVMHTDGSGQINLSRDPGEDRFATWTPDGRIVWSRFITSFDLHTMDASGANVRPIVLSPFEETHASVSPDGRWLVYQSNRIAPFSLLVAPIAGGEPRPLFATAGSSTDLGPMWGVAKR